MSRSTRFLQNRHEPHGPSPASCVSAAQAGVGYLGLGMRDSYVLLYRAGDRVEASLLAHVLETADIPVALVGGNVLDETAESARTEMWVQREDKDRGRHVIEEFQRRGPDPCSGPGNAGL